VGEVEEVVDFHLMAEDLADAEEHLEVIEDKEVASGLILLVVLELVLIKRNPLKNKGSMPSIRIIHVMCC